MGSITVLVSDAGTPQPQPSAPSALGRINQSDTSGTKHQSNKKRHGEAAYVKRKTVIQRLEEFTCEPSRHCSHKPSTVGRMV